ncbi:unnamed protein product, partial [Mesorhabditis spiculigera]
SAILTPSADTANNTDHPFISFGDSMTGGHGRFSRGSSMSGGMEFEMGSVPDINPYQDEERPKDDLPKEVAIVEPILRVLQLLCENHNSLLQNFIRKQSDRANHNLVAETLMFLDTVCGSTKGSLGVFGEIGVHNFSLITQTLNTLTEFCQGPCHENQNTMAMQENGLNIIISLVLNDIKPLADERMDLALEIKSNASKLLLAIMESRHDSENAERVLHNMTNMAGGPKQLVHAIAQAFKMANSTDLAVAQVRRDILSQAPQMNGPRSLLAPPVKNGQVNLPGISVDGSGTISILDEEKKPEEDFDGKCPETTIVNPKEVGHNIYILAHQLARHSQDLEHWLDPEGEHKSADTEEALRFYKNHTAQIEIVRRDRTLERVVFPIHPTCSFLTKETKQSVYENTERDAQGSKVTEFFGHWEDLYEEMRWQEKLQKRMFLSWCTQRLRLWGRLCLFFAILVNCTVALHFPFTQNDEPYTQPDTAVHAAAIGSCIFLYFRWDDRSAMGTSWSFMVCIAIAMFSVSTLLMNVLGIVPALVLIGIAQVFNKVIHVTAFVSNRGLVDKHWKERLADQELYYHLVYLFLCVAGLLLHPFYYAFLLFDIVASEDTLQNVIKSVTKNWKSIILTGLLALILVYLFAIFGFLFFQKDFRLEVEQLQHPAIGGPSVIPPFLRKVEETCPKDGCAAEEGKEDDDEEEKVYTCDSLRMCIITTLNWGLRNGGGIGDVLRNIHPSESLFYWRILYDMSFFVVCIVIVLNLIFGVIIDTFGDLRTEKNEKEDILKNSCFICGLERGKFDNRSVSFEDHREKEHNLWHYLYFIVWLKIKDETEFTGPESYVHECIINRDLDWFPRMQAISLKEEDQDADQPDQMALREELRSLNQKLREMAGQFEEFRQVVDIMASTRGATPM